MTEFRIDAELFKDMLISAANYLEHNKKLLNDLNVFPVPDGDTGTNMLLTLVSAVKEVTVFESATIGKLTQAMSDGALKGARGNSGVILSQLFRGFAKSVSVDKEALTTEDFARAIELGVETAYKAVMKPKEGTILTVARSMAEEARRQVNGGANLLMLVDAVIEAGQATLKKTPDMLPVLKEAGVVDAGGAGLLVIYKGFKMALDGEEITDALDLSTPAQLPAAGMTDISTANIEFLYCTEFFITNLAKDVTEDAVDRLRDKLMHIGDSLVVVGDPTLVKVHVHTNTPGKALQYALRLGELSRVKVENMKEQHESITGLSPGRPQKPIALVAVCAGDGLGNIFKDYKVDELILGGQSMNPSAEDIKAAIEKAPSDTVIVLPNNKNIILAAEQAGKLTRKKVYVIPTKSFPQGLSAVLVFNEELSIEENVKEMSSAIGEVKSAQVTRAIRDSHTNGFAVKEGEYIGVFEDAIIAHANSIPDIVKALMEKMVSSTDAVVTFYYGEGVSEEEALALSEEIGDIFGDMDMEVYNGGQPVYDYIISVE